jgi:hypothetical protein
MAFLLLPFLKEVFSHRLEPLLSLLLLLLLPLTTVTTAWRTIGFSLVLIPGSDKTKLISNPISIQS